MSQAGISNSKNNEYLLAFLFHFIAFSLITLGSDSSFASSLPPQCERTITARVVALEQVYTYNRFGAFNPAGMVFALRRDVVANDDVHDNNSKQSLRFKQDEAIPSKPNIKQDLLLAGHVKLRSDKRPRPLTLRVNEGDCLQVTFTNLLSPKANGQEVFNEPLARLRPDEGDVTENKEVQRQAMVLDSEEPRTRHASMHVNGLDYVQGVANFDASGNHALLDSDGANIGNNISSLAAPGETRVYTWYARKEGGYLFYSMGAPIGGEGDGGQLGLGLFGSVNVQPKGSIWYRSQVTHEDLLAVIDTSKGDKGYNPNGSPIINYGAVYPSSHRRHGDPVLSLLKPLPANKRKECPKTAPCEIIYGDLTAVIELPQKKNGEEHPRCHNEDGSTCTQSYREFTAIFHDEVTAVQAFPELGDEGNSLSRVKDGMAINYGVAGMGSAVLANRKGVGPAALCAECKLEEFFLSSWANGDPAMLVARDPTGDPDKPLKAVMALYPDDPSNVYHSYMGDPVKFRNMHAGPKETHVFHLHAHQWVRNDADENSTYLDSQTISPGASFSYKIFYGGSGNRNFTPGDAIFHCHLYPHFAQGMWSLWRTHDVFEAGTKLDDEGTPRLGARALPDGEIAAGTPIPAIIPVPHAGLPPMPTEEFKGYPFYIAGQAGHRPPQPPYDLVVENGIELNGGLGRHRILHGSTIDGIGDASYSKPYKKPNGVDNDLYYQGRDIANKNAARVAKTSGDPNLFVFGKTLDAIRLELLPLEGTPAEKRAIEFHEGIGRPLVETIYGWEARSYDSFDSSGKRKPFLVNGKSPKPGAPYADPCPIGQPLRTYKAAYIQFDLTVNKAGWHDPQARIAVLQEDVKPTLDGKRPPEPLFFRANSDECVAFHATNLIPSVLNLDDFQLYSPTDVIGQHIHLVKFDVTSSDGSANGWNYEDGTYSPDEVRERIDANNKYQASFGGTQILKPRQHPFFFSQGFSQARCGERDDRTGALRDKEEDGPWCGAQTTAQRWWADPLLNSKGQDRTIRTVFTHDHLSPSSHQQHGLYAALVIEPRGSRWQKMSGDEILGGERLQVRDDGGPTSYAANIIDVFSDSGEDISRREFNLAFADFAIVYDEKNNPVNGPGKIASNLPVAVLHPTQPRPESISAGDPGTQLINYRNEPIPLRIGTWKEVNAGKECSDQVDENQPKLKRFCQKDTEQGEMANVFSSEIHKGQVSSEAFQFSDEPKGARQPGDPATPLLTAYHGDRVQLRLVQGAQEENHIFTMHGVKWLSQPGSPNSGYMNAQPIGISEHFEFDIKFSSDGRTTDYLYSSSATDNLWDGMWGLLRAYPNYLKCPPPSPQVDVLCQQAELELKNLALAHLDSNPLIAKNISRSDDLCPEGAHPHNFSIKARRAKNLLPEGRLSYNDRYEISDPNAILFIDETEPELYDAYSSGARKPEPLILRASAGSCIHLTLENALDPSMPDGPDDRENKHGSWSFNMLPPIVEGFNFNQVASSNRISLHPQLLAAIVKHHDGANIGRNDDKTIGPNDLPKVYKWYAGDDKFDAKTGDQPPAPIEFGITALRDMGDVIKHTSHGAIGALIIEPEGSEWGLDCGENASLHLKTRAMRDICSTEIDPVTKKKVLKVLFREFVLLYQDDLSLVQGWDSKTRMGDAMANLRNGDDSEDSGQKAFNYRTEPIWARLGAGGPATGPEAMSQYDFSKAFSSKLDVHGKCDFDGMTDPKNDHAVGCDPYTPLFKAIAGTPIRFRIVHPGGHPRNHGFTLFGHNWQLLPWTKDSTVMGDNPNSDVVGSASNIGPASHVNIVTKAGGEFAVPGDYLYRTQDGFMFGGGLWGILRVECKPGDQSCLKKQSGPPKQRPVQKQSKTKAAN